MEDAKGLTLPQVKRFLRRAAGLARLVHAGELNLTGDEPSAIEAELIEAVREDRLQRLYGCYVAGSCLRLYFERDLPPGTVLTDELLTDEPTIREARDMYRELSTWMPTLEEEVLPGDPGA